MRDIKREREINRKRDIKREREKNGGELGEKKIDSQKPWAKSFFIKINTKLQRLRNAYSLMHGLKP